MSIAPTNKQIEEIFTNVVDLFLIPNFLNLGMEASGEWRSSLEIRTFENRVEIWGRDYSIYLSEGREPNADQSDEAVKKFVGWAGSTFLAKWVQDKGLLINPYAVAYKIAREGTTWRRKGGSSVLTILESKEVMDYINNEMKKIFAFNVKADILKKAKKVYA